MQQLPEALAPMANYAQFVLCKFTLDRTTGKTNKIPYNPHTATPFAKGVNWQEDPTKWATAAQALATAEALGAGWGVGFLFTAADPFFFVDLDNCLRNGAWSEVATHLIGSLPGAAVEISTSQAGAHIFGCYASIPEHRCKNTALGLELYHERRFAAITGDIIAGNIWGDYTAHLPQVIDFYFAPGSEEQDFEWSTTPVDGYTSKLTDDELIAKACESSGAQALFRGVTFKDLWTRNEEALGAKWPSAKDEAFDGSSADLSLAQHLAFWTGNNSQRMLEIMEKSALARDKWEGREGYLEGTIEKACSMQDVFYSMKQDDATPIEEIGETFSDAPARSTGYKLMPVDLQLEHFAGCMYVIQENRVFTPSAGLLKQDQFNAVFGGYAFQLDDENRAKPTRKAWEAFTDSQGIRWPRVHDTCFRPREKPGAILIEGHCRIVNTYKPIPVPSEAGDVSLFKIHLAKLLPDERDRTILLSWMAACVQHKGYKFQWAPFIQGVEGNGKSFLTNCMVAAIGRGHCHLPKSDEFGEKFNDWAFDKIFIGVEDVYVPDAKKEVMEIIKPLISADWMPKRAMQRGQEMFDICCNWMLNSNHKDGWRKTGNDRRVAPFFTAQQSKADKVRDGMTAEYFQELRSWASNGGYAAITHYLSTYEIRAEFNPALGCGGLAHEAPITTSTDAAIVAGLGGVEQEVAEAVDQGYEGFRAGWISSVALRKLLEDLNRSNAIPPNKRRVLLQSLGYDYHPALPDGKSTRALDIDDGQRPKLFIKEGHISAGIRDASAAVAAYVKAQTEAQAAQEVERLFATEC